MLETVADLSGMAALGRVPVEVACGVDEGDKLVCKGPLQFMHAEFYCKEEHQLKANINGDVLNACGLLLMGEQARCASSETKNSMVMLETALGVRQICRTTMQAPKEVGWMCQRCWIVLQQAAMMVQALRWVLTRSIDALLALSGLGVFLDDSELEKSSGRNGNRERDNPKGLLKLGQFGRRFLLMKTCSRVTKDARGTSKVLVVRSESDEKRRVNCLWKSTFLV